MTRTSFRWFDKAYWRWLLPAGVLLIAFFFRFYRLADYPRGEFFDPAYEGLDAVRLLQRGGWPLFLPTNGGREAINVYMVMPAIMLFGTTPLSLRLPAAAAGFATVILLFAFLYKLPELVDSDILPRRHRLALALLGSLALAVSPWHIVVSHIAQRPPLTALLSIPAFWLLLKGWRSGRRRDLLLAGLFIGLGGYTYSASRLIPLIVLLALAPEFITAIRNSFRPAIKKANEPPALTLRECSLRLALIAAAALLVFAPLGVYFIRHPELFTLRASSVMVWQFFSRPADIAAAMGENSLQVLSYFCCDNNHNLMFGPAGFPGLHPFLTLFLVAGLLGSLLRFRQFFFRLLALWWLVGVFPSVISIEAPHPLRMIVAVAPTAILVALGAFFLNRWLRLSRSGERRELLLPALTGLLALATMPSFAQAYYGEWGNLKETRRIFDEAAVVTSRKALELAGQGYAVYLPLERYKDPPLLYYLSGPIPRQAVPPATLPPADKALLLSPLQDKDSAVWVRLYQGRATILPPLTAVGREQVRTAWETSTVPPLLTDDGSTAALLAPLPAELLAATETPAVVLDARLGGARLAGISYPRTINAKAESIPVTLFWQAAETMGTDDDLLLQLVDDRQVVQGSGSEPLLAWVYPTSYWRPGVDVIPSLQLVKIKPGLPPGRYRLALALVDSLSGRRLPVSARGVISAPDTLFLGPLKVPLPAPASSPAAGSALARFGRLAELRELKIDRRDDKIELRLLWEALQPDGADYTLFLHLLNDQDQVVRGHDSPPRQGSYPTGIWEAGERIEDTIELDATGLAAGEYRLEMGFYNPADGQRLPVILPGGGEDLQQRLLLEQKIVIP